MRQTVFVLLPFIGGCYMHAMMLPVAGPLAQRSPPPVMSVKVNGIMGNSGSLSFTTPDGDKCNGRWSSAAGEVVGYTSGSLLSQYGSTYFQETTIAAGGGQNPGQALAVCKNGRSFQIEFVTGGGTSHGYGIGKDSDGNIYKFIF